MTAHRPHDPVSPEIAAAAARLTGTPADMAKRLGAMLDEGAPTPAPRESADARREREADTVAHIRTVAALRHRLADDFAAARGWKLTISPLSTKEVARRATPGGNWHRRANEWSAYLPNSSFYRGEDGRVAAAVGHPTAELIEGNPLLVEMWAVEQGLILSRPDSPSWQHPGRTVLVMFQSAEVVAATPAPAAAEGKASAADDPAQAARPHASAGVEKRDIGRPIPAAEHAPPTAPDLAALQPGAPLDLDGAEPGDSVEHGAASDPAGKIDMAPAEPAPEVDPAPSTAPDHHEMRPVAPLDLDGITPRNLDAEEDPDFDIINPAELLIDEQYQRGLSPKSIALIRRIVENWSWAKFKVPTCVRVDGRLHVIDGQHSVIAAATHPGIQAVPVLIAKVPEVADRAAAFVSHATNRLQATAVQIHRAALTAGDQEAVALDAVCRAAGVELLPFPAGKGTAWAPGQTVAVVGIRKVIAKRGAARAVEILSTLAGADLAPIAGDHVRLVEMLLCDEAYAGGFTPDQLTAALRSLTARTHAEARELAIAQRLAPWRALAAVLYRNHTKPVTSRKRASA